MTLPFDVDARSASGVGHGGGSAVPVVVTTARCEACAGRSQCLPGDLDHDALKRLDGRLVATSRTVTAGDTLLRAGDRFNALFAVRSGSFKTLVNTRRGGEHVIGFRMSGDLVGLEGIGSGAHHVVAIALEDSRVCVITFAVLQALAREVPRLQERFQRLISRDIVRNQETLLLLGARHASERIAGFVLDLADRLKERGYSGSTLVLRMQRGEIGSHLGLELETVCRTLTRLQAAGLMRIAQREIRITDRDGLERVRDGH